MNNIKLILQDKAVLRADKFNKLFDKISIYHPPEVELEEYAIDEKLNYTKDRMDKFITTVETIFDVADDIMFSYGTIYPVGEYETIVADTDYLVNHFLDDPFFLKPNTDTFGNYPVQAFTHDVNSNRFSAEGTSEFSVDIAIKSGLPDGLYFIITTHNGIVATKENNITLASTVETTYIKQYTKIDSASELLSHCSEPYAFACNNNLVLNEQYIIGVGSAIKEMDVNKLYIKDIVIGKNITAYPYTYEITNPMPTREVKLSTATELVGCSSNVTEEYSNPGDIITIVFESEESLAKNFKLAFKS